MKTSTGVAILDQIIGKAFKIEGRNIAISTETIKLFSISKYNYFLEKHPEKEYINLELIPSNIRQEMNLTDHTIDCLFPGVRKTVVTKLKLPKNQVRDDIALALRHSKRYHTNFFEIKDQAIVELKSRTLAVMSVVVRVIRETDDYQLLYDVIKGMNIHTEIPLNSGKEFYYYAKGVSDFGLSKLNQ